MSPDRDQQLAKKSRSVALLIAGAMLLWLGAQYVGGKLGLAPRFVFLFDLAAIGAFVFALVVIIQIWRARQKD